MSDKLIDNQACSGRVETIQLLLDGELRPPERQVFEDHLAACQQCQTHLAELKAVYAELALVTEMAVPDDLADQVMAKLPAQALPPAISLERRGHPIFLGQLGLAIQIVIGLIALSIASTITTPNLNHQILWLPWLIVSEMFSSFGNWLTDLTGYVDLWAQKWPPTIGFVGLAISPTLAVVLVTGLGLVWLVGNTLLLTTHQSTPKNGGV